MPDAAFLKISGAKLEYHTPANIARPKNNL